MIDIRSVADWKAWIDCPDNLYVGRAHPILGDNSLGNPYTVSRYGRQSAIQLYKDHILPSLSDGQIQLIRSKRKLACWCTSVESGAPLVCHGQLLLDL